MSWGLRFRIRQYVKNSLWLMPLIAGVIGLILSELLSWVDAQSPVAVLQYAPETATAVVSATIAAAVSLTGFVVTVTVLGVQQATGIFSPRYMRLWYRDGRLKLVLAELVGTLMFSIAVIRRIQPDSVPDVSVSIAGGGLIIGLLLFLLYFDRFLHRMRPVAVAELLAHEARRALDDWLEEADRDDLALVAGGPVAAGTAPTFILRSTRSGTIQAIDIQGLCALARRYGCLIVFRHTVGDFVPVGAAILEVHGGAPPAAGRRLSSLMALGTERTIEQDPAFAIRVMVDIAIRALSPAVNDPTTAVQVLDHLGETLRLVGATERLARGTKPEILTSGVIMPVRAWPDFLALGVTEIRGYGATSIQIARRLRALLEELGELVRPENRSAVDAELRLLDATVRAAYAGGIDLDGALSSDDQGLGGPTAAHQRLSERVA
jgi:uncharacterized membrane protein